MRAAFVTFLTALLCLGLAPAANAVTCANTLSCSAADINRMTMGERLDFVRGLSAGPAAEIAPGYPRRWGNIEGIIEFFTDRGMGATGSWVSYVDAGILEGIERGIAIASGRSTDTFGNPGSQLWASYLLRLGAGELSGRAAHDLAWSQAEQASTEHGVVLAEHVHGLRPSDAEERFYQFSDFYRWMLRSRPAVLDVLAPPTQGGKQLTFLDWFTDVTNDVPTRKGAALAYDLGQFDAPAGTVDLVAVAAAYARYLSADYLAAV
ncbi:hypothetical protein FPZ12_012900 [Amycolatopsis acidicola]|uniref:Uncharacterized protein n=1 Tax=Amycolatopsis acidicola TaxID=2596893 RepID=A0A5N0V6Z1_9PSEU|nr:hypothetical protein [Amycolatopsis acidicola]KAA9162127.1 hypothetical protein FPZ12_012900 [Amycolatopsis acidicola]